MSMPAPTVTDGKPFILGTDATLVIDGTELDCVTNKITLKPETTMVTSTTLCGAIDMPGITKWTLNCVLYQSFEPNGTYNVLSKAKLAGVPVAYQLRFHEGPAAVGNPEFAGMVIPQPFNISDSQAGALVEVDFTWSCTGEPTEDVGSGPAPIGTGASGTTRAAARRTEAA